MSDSRIPNQHLPLLKTSLHRWHQFTAVSYCALILLVFSWYLIWFPPTSLAPWALASIAIIPLLFPLRGILRRRYYTYAWAQFIIMLYFCHATVNMMTTSNEMIIASIELVLVTLHFTAAVMAIRTQKKITELTSSA